MVATRVEGVRIERTADEILAVKEGSLEAHAINQSAAAVYDLCDGTPPSLIWPQRFIAARAFPPTMKSSTLASLRAGRDRAGDTR